MKVIHIHTDRKFFHLTNVFSGGVFENTVLVLGKSDTNIEVNAGDLYFEHPVQSLKAIIEVCRQADLVILYGLDPVKGKIALSLPREIKVAWRFFGFELYSKIRNTCLSPASIEAMSQDSTPSIGSRIRSSYGDLKSRILGGSKAKDLVADAMQRIDFFLGLSADEYHFLQTFFKDLPSFVQWPFTKDPQLEFERFDKEVKPIVLLGNNRSVYNNHLDIIEMIKQTDGRGDFDFRLLFNYGKEDIYATRVRQEAAQWPCIEMLEDFMPKPEFEALYNRASALVLNGYRQMAFANIRFSFRTGVKVYLNPKSVIYSWLLTEGFIVFTMEDFESDLKSKNVSLALNEMEHNFQQWVSLSEKYSINDFQKAMSAFK